MSMEDHAYSRTLVPADSVEVLHTDTSVNPPIVTRHLMALIDAMDACKRFPEQYSMPPKPEPEPGAAVEISAA
jgi:hypothetical protein